MSNPSVRRSIDDLFGPTPPAPSSGVADLDGAKLIPVSLLSPNPYQPRALFDPGALEELAASIRVHGVLQPLAVRQTGDGYQIVAGERRWRAAQAIGRETVPCIVRDLNDEAMEVLALVENVQRADLDPLDEAHAYARLMERFGLSLRDVAGQVHRSHEHVARRLRLIADPALEEAVRAGLVGLSVAQEVARLDEVRRAGLLARANAGEHLTMKDLAPSLAGPMPTDTPPPLPLSPHDDHGARGSFEESAGFDGADDDPVTGVKAAASSESAEEGERDAVGAPPGRALIHGANLEIVRLLRATDDAAPRDLVRKALRDDLRALNS